MERVLLDGETLKLEELESVSRREARAELAPAALDRLPRASTEETGARARAEGRLEHALVLAHASAVGPPLRTAEVRAAMLLCANGLAAGGSGVRRPAVELLLAMLGANCIPVVPEEGSSDRAALAHVALVLVGEGEAFLDTRRLPGREALARAKLGPVVLEPGEGSALLRGSAASVAVGALALLRAEQLARLADVAAALSLAGGDRVSGAITSERAAAGARGQALAEARLCELLGGSPGAPAGAPEPAERHVPGSIRAAARLHGAARDGMACVREALAQELNPSPGDSAQAADLAEPRSAVALPLDLLALGAAQLASASAGRVGELLSAPGLPPLLSPNPQTSHGYIAAPGASASLAMEARLLSQPVSAEPGEGAGLCAAVKARRAVERLRACLAIELLVAAQAADLRRFRRPAGKLEEAHARLRSVVPHPDEDRPFCRDVEAICRLIDDGVMDL